MSARTGWLVVGAAVMMAWAVPVSVRAQDRPERPLVRASAFVAASLREGPTGIGVGRDVRSFSARVTWSRRGVQPWVQASGFTRPDLACLPGLPCNTDGWTALAGVTLPFSRDDSQRGIHSYFLGGVGAGFSEESIFAYLLGVGTTLAIVPRVAPSFEVRWEDLPGIRNVVMLSLGLQVDLF